MAAAKKIQEIPLGIEDAMAQGNCSERHVREEIKRKNLRASKPGKRIVLNQEDIDKWIKRKTI